jgi:hypothetical protein
MRDFGNGDCGAKEDWISAVSQLTISDHIWLA